jgi:hypothetical protein
MYQEEEEAYKNATKNQKVGWACSCCGKILPQTGPFWSVVYKKWQWQCRFYERLIPSGQMCNRCDVAFAKSM